MKQLLVALIVLWAVSPYVRSYAAADEPPTPIDLYVFRAGTTPTQKCKFQTDTDLDVARTEIKALVVDMLPSPSFTVNLHKEKNPDPLRDYLHKSGHLIIATYCVTADVYNISISAYATDPSNHDNPVLSSSVSGTFDVLASSNWSQIGSPPSPAPLIPNIAFLPLANDSTNTVNSQLLHNLPITVIQTPAPLPTASPSSGANVPMTRLDECKASRNHMIVVGRAVIQNSAGASETAKLVTGAAAISQSAPSPWGGIYTGAGVLFANLYSPNSADVSADVITCALDSAGKNWSMNWVGGHHIAGHASTPLFNASPLQVQRALDLATTDLENQLFCIILFERPAAVGSGTPVYNLGRLLSPDATSGATLPYITWCKDYYATVRKTTTAVDLPSITNSGGAPADVIRVLK